MKRGRPHPNDLKVVPLPPAIERVPPPDHLTAKQRKLFVDVVASCPSNQFSPVDVYLLTNFVRATLIVDRAMKDLGRCGINAKKRAACMKVIEQGIKLQSLLGTKLRITTSSRTDPQKLSRAHAAHRPSFYDTMDKGDDAWS